MNLPNPTDHNTIEASEPPSSAWLQVVAEKARTMRFGVIQIVVHDSQVVQIERTERTRIAVNR